MCEFLGSVAFLALLLLIPTYCADRWERFAQSPRVPRAAAAFVGVVITWFFLSLLFAPVMPSFRFESSDGSFVATTLPAKGTVGFELHGEHHSASATAEATTFELVRSEFERVRSTPGRSTITLFRTDRRGWLYLTQLLDNLTHPRWSLPYRARAD